MSAPTIDDLTITAKAALVDAEPMADNDHPDRLFLPKKIVARYWPTPEGWRLWSLYISGPAVLKSGQIGKSERCAYYSARIGTSAAPDWAQEFATAHVPRGESR